MIRARLTATHDAVERHTLWRLLLAGILVRVLIMPFTGHIDVLSEARRIHYFWENSIWFDLNSARSVSNFIQLFFYSFTRFLMPNPEELFFMRDVAASTATFTEFFAFVGTPGSWRALFLIKTPFLFMDLASLVLLLHLMKDAPSRRRMTLWWLFNPVTVFSFYFFGRFEAIPIFFFILMIFALTRKRWLLAALSLTLAANAREPFALMIPILALFLLNKGIVAKAWERVGAIFILGLGLFGALNLHLIFGLSLTSQLEVTSLMAETRGASLIGFALYWFSLFVFSYGLLSIWMFSRSARDIGMTGLLGFTLFWFAFFAFTTTTSHFTAWMIVGPLIFAARNPQWTRPLLFFFAAWIGMWAIMTDPGVFTHWLAAPISLHLIAIPILPKWYQVLVEPHTFMILPYMIWVWQSLFVASIAYLASLAVLDFRRIEKNGGTQ